MTPLAYLFAGIALGVVILLCWVVRDNGRLLDIGHEKDLEIDRLERALGASRQAHESTRSELLGANVSERYFRVAYDHQTVLRMEMELAGRVLPDLRDDQDLAVPSWPMVEAPIFDGIPDAPEVDAIVLAHIAEQVAS